MAYQKVFQNLVKRGGRGRGAEKKRKGGIGLQISL